MGENQHAHAFLLLPAALMLFLLLVQAMRAALISMDPAIPCVASSATAAEAVSRFVNDLLKHTTALLPIHSVFPLP